MSSCVNLLMYSSMLLDKLASKVAERPFVSAGFDEVSEGSLYGSVDGRAGDGGDSGGDNMTCRQFGLIDEAEDPSGGVSTMKSSSSTTSSSVSSSQSCEANRSWLVMVSVAPSVLKEWAKGEEGVSRVVAAWPRLAGRMEDLLGGGGRNGAGGGYGLNWGIDCINDFSCSRSS